MNIGEYIKNLRKSKNMTATAFGESLGVTHSTISKIETGTKTSISDELIDKLIEVYNIPDEDIMILKPKYAYKQAEEVTTKLLNNICELAAESQSDYKKTLEILKTINSILEIKEKGFALRELHSSTKETLNTLKSLEKYRSSEK